MEMFALNEAHKTATSKTSFFPVFLIIAGELLKASRRLPAHSSKLLAYETNFHTRAM